MEDALKLKLKRGKFQFQFAASTLHRTTVVVAAAVAVTERRGFLCCCGVCLCRVSGVQARQLVRDLLLLRYCCYGEAHCFGTTK